MNLGYDSGVGDIMPIREIMLEGRFDRRKIALTRATSSRGLNFALQRPDIETGFGTSVDLNSVDSFGASSSVMSFGLKTGLRAVH